MIAGFWKAIEAYDRLDAELSSLIEIYGEDESFSSRYISGQRDMIRGQRNQILEQHFSTVKASDLVGDHETWNDLVKYASSTWHNAANKVLSQFFRELHPVFRSVRMRDGEIVPRVYFSADIEVDSNLTDQIMEATKQIVNSLNSDSNLAKFEIMSKSRKPKDNLYLVVHGDDTELAALVDDRNVDVDSMFFYPMEELLIQCQNRELL